MRNIQTVSFINREPQPNRFSIGLQGDHLVTTIAFQLTTLAGRNAAYVKLELPDGALKVPLSIRSTGYIWDVGRNALRYFGRFPAQLVVTGSCGEVVWQSALFYVDVGKSIPDDVFHCDDSHLLTEQVQAAQDSVARAELAADRAEEARRFAEELSAQLGEIQGAPGAPGMDGQDGKDGVDGRDGKDGADGRDGRSAYNAAVMGGYAADEAQFHRDLSAIGGLEKALAEIVYGDTTLETEEQS